MSIGEIFTDAQRSTVSHRALAKRLRRLEITIPNFIEQIQQCIYRLLEVAKSENAGNRVVKFLIIYIEAIQPQPQENGEGTSNISGDSNGGAIVSAVLLGLSPYMSAKDKTIRYRATQIISQVLGVLTAIDDDLYSVIRHELLKRLRDKVPAIRLEAVLALGRIVENEMDEEDEQRRRQSNSSDDSEFEDPDQDDPGSSGLLQKLLDVLQNDSNAEVRRALLLNLPITPTTLPYLLERARDRDGPTRRALYAKLLPSLGDFRHLSLSMREKLLRWGLRDRDEKVRKAAARIFRERWIEDCAATRIENTGEDTGAKKKELHAPSIPALLELLERIDVVNNGNEAGIALEAMKEFWAGRPDYMDEITFDDDFWTTLTPESAFMARTFNDYCQSDSNYQSMVEEKMPEVTRLGFYIQKYINTLMEQSRNDTETGAVNEEETAEQEFVLEQLLHIAHTLDYTDEIGRRKMFSLLREALAMADLPEESTKLTVEALRLVCNADAAGEREFTAVVLEAIAEVHDTIMGSDVEPDHDDDSFVSARSEVSGGSQSSRESTPTGPSVRQGSKPGKKNKNLNLSEEEQEQKAVREIMVNMKCLHIAQCMLQNVVGNLSTNVHLETMLHNLVIPAVRSHEAPIRERGLVCLGLCCLLEPSLAQENTKLFVHCLSRGNEGLRVLSIQILCDILLTSHRPPPSTNFVSQDTNTTQQEKEKQTTEIVEKLIPFVRGLGYTDQDDVQMACTTSLAKLILCGWYNSSTGANEEAFDEAVQRAEEGKAKGWDVLKKVRDAVKVPESVEKGAAEKEKVPRESAGNTRRSSGGGGGAVVMTG